MYAQINRDPFSRTTLMRRVERDPYALHRGCTWCGQLNRHGSLFRYWTETDGGRNLGEGNPFCSISCKRSFES
jgi:hypothetical protein